MKAVVKDYAVLVCLTILQGVGAVSGLTRAKVNNAAKEHTEHILRLEAIGMEGVREKNLLSINCSEIDWTFHYQPPFLHQKLPKCGDVIQPQ